MMFKSKDPGGNIMKRLSICFIITMIFLILSVCIPKAMASDRVHLRNQAKQLSDEDVKSMLIEFNFFDRTKNKNGAFPNDFMDNGDGTVTDRATGLMWQKDGSLEGMTWADAKEYVNKLNNDRFAGHSGWRLPTIEELASLMKSSRAKGNLYIDPTFSERQIFCWSADTFGPDAAWYVSFKAGMIRHIYHFFYHVRAVRTIKRGL
jgi:hypothetical protein